MIETCHSVEEAANRQKDAWWAGRIGYILAKAYPGHGWEVEANCFQGIVKMFNRHMSPIHGYILRIEEINLPTLDRDIMRIGGEILERFGLSRERFEADKIREIQNKTMGRAKADMS